MANVPIERLSERLWPRGEDECAYAILDGARDPAIFPLVTGARWPQRCLYLGRLAPPLARAAPYLVQLAPSQAATRQLLGRAWGESWGVFLRTAAPMDALHRHLRRFLRVQDELGRRMVFRYYDPRILRVYLPTCTVTELEYVFGPVESYVVEGETAERILEFRLSDGALAQSEVRAEQRLPWLGDYLRKSREE